MPTSSGKSSPSQKEHGYEDIARGIYPRARIQLLKAQGACSTTYLVEEAGDSPTRKILQFRAAKFSLDVDVCAAAKAIYKDYAPSTRSVPLPVNHRAGDDVVCYEMEVLPGVPYSTLLAPHPSTDPAFATQKQLVEDFADLISLSWPTPQHPLPSTKTSSSGGRVGSQIPQKLARLCTALPTAALRLQAHRARARLPLLSELPAVLNHGDIVPSNIMLDPRAHRITGLVDWAEAEPLPFGTCLHGLEYLLGVTASTPPRPKRRDSGLETRAFRYYACAGALRRVFWARLAERVPVLAGEGVGEAVAAAKAVGTLLWYGFAWDEGAIDRVVNGERDGEVLGTLEAFLSYELDLEAQRDVRLATGGEAG